MVRAGNWNSGEDKNQRFYKTMASFFFYTVIVKVVSGMMGERGRFQSSVVCYPETVRVLGRHEVVNQVSVIRKWKSIFLRLEAGY